MTKMFPLQEKKIVTTPRPITSLINHLMNSFIHSFVPSFVHKDIDRKKIHTKSHTADENKLLTIASDTQQTTKKLLHNKLYTSYQTYTNCILTLVHTLHIIAKNSILKQHMKNKILKLLQVIPHKNIKNYCTQTLPLIPNILHQLYSRWFTLCISLLPHTPTPTPHTPYILTPYAPYIHTTLHSIHNIRFNSDPPPHAHTRTTTSPFTLQLKYTPA